MRQEHFGYKRFNSSLSGITSFQLSATTIMSRDGALSITDHIATGYRMDEWDLVSSVATDYILRWA